MMRNVRSHSANGILCFGPSFFVSAAWILSIASSTLCNFFQLDEDNERSNLFQSIGFWCYEVSGSGTRYSYKDVDFDDNFQKARAFGTTANVLGFVVWLFYLFAACIRFPPTFFIFAGLLCMFTCLFEGLKFWMNKSTFFCDGNNLGCSIDTAAKCGISAAVLWFVAFLMTCAHAAERMSKQGERGGEQGEEGDE